MAGDCSLCRLADWLAGYINEWVYIDMNNRKSMFNVGRMEGQADRHPPSHPADQSVSQSVSQSGGRAGRQAGEQASQPT